jgi:peptidyl-prolyl cis-trans isomerase C
MKLFTTLLAVLAVCAYGQAPSAPPKPAASKPAPVKPANQAEPAAAVKPDAVIFKVGDRPVTRAEFERIVAAFPPEIQQNAKSNPRQVMQSYFLMQNLSKMAETEKLDQTSPFKEQLELQRVQFLATTIVNRESTRIQVSEEDMKARYEADKENKYEQAKISAIVVMFTDPKAITAQVDMSDPKKPAMKDVVGVRLEPEAKRIADDIVAQLRGGAEFATVARQKSEDKASAAKGGDFGVVRRIDRIPEDIKKAVFALKPGEVSAPVRQPMSFYIIKLENRTVQPFTEVQQFVANDIKQERFQKWMTGIQKQFEITVEEPSYFEPAPVPAPQSGAAAPSPSAASPKAR